MSPRLLKSIIALAVFAAAGCTTLQQPVSAPLYQYRADLEITVDDVTFEGMAITAFGEKDISIVSKAPLNVLKITSCARDFVVQNVDEDWFGGVGKSYTYHFTPSNYETEGPCPLYIQALGSNGTAAWGYVLWRTDEKLAAQMDCNGERKAFAGASACQTKAAASRQEIYFARPVRFKGSTLCQVTADPKIANAFIVSTSGVGFCYATFTDGTLWHSMVLLGYDQVLVRP